MSGFVRIVRGCCDSSEGEAHAPTSADFDGVIHGQATFALGERWSDKAFQRLQAKVAALHARLVGAGDVMDVVLMRQVAPGRLTVTAHPEIAAAIAEIEREYAELAVLLRAEADADRDAERA